MMNEDTPQQETFRFTIEAYDTVRVRYHVTALDEDDAYTKVFSRIFDDCQEIDGHFVVEDSMEIVSQEKVQ